VRPLVYGVIRADEVPAAARIFVDTFAPRVRAIIARTDHAYAFYADLFEMKRQRWPDGFLAARDERLAGFLILTRARAAPGARAGARRFAARMIARLLRGSYGWPLPILQQALAATRREYDERATRPLRDVPHVYAVAVHPEATRRGIGSGLVHAARDACQPGDGSMWLRVEADNEGAIRLYERLGFRFLVRGAREHLMVWDFAAEGD
jgi:ribosomal protein S18 acetylase RimI-like enzyme